MPTLPSAIRSTLITVLAMVVLLMFTTASALEGYININTASQQQIELLPFTGVVRAGAIIDYRRKHGAFTSATQLLDVPGIGPATYGAIRRFIHLEGITSLRASAMGSASVDQPENIQITGMANISKIVTHPGEVMLLPDKQFFEVLTSYIDEARQSIRLATYVFKITDSAKNRARLLVERLAEAHDRGVDVSVLLELSDFSKSINEENEQTIQLLRKHGIQVELDSEETISHMKLVVIDDRFCFVGSHNMTHSALDYNHEFSLLVDSKEMASELTSYIERIRAEGKN